MEKDAFKTPLAMRIAGRVGEAPVLHARALRDGREAEVTRDAPLTRATQAPTDRALRDEKLGRLGDSPFALGALDVELPEGAIVPISSLNRARRALVGGARRGSEARARDDEDERSGSRRCFEGPAAGAAPRGGLFVLCRNLEQARAALDAGATASTSISSSSPAPARRLRALRDEGARFVGVAPPRIRKPGEEKIDRYLRPRARRDPRARPRRAPRSDPARPRIGDFSLNVTNRLTAAEVLRRGLSRFTPSFDLDAAQLVALLDRRARAVRRGRRAPPDAALPHGALRDRGAPLRGTRPPDVRPPVRSAPVSLRDRAGMDHPVEADVGCRNTVFHAAAQSAAPLVPSSSERGVRASASSSCARTRRRSPKSLHSTRTSSPASTNRATWCARYASGGGYGVVRGSLRVVHSP